MNNNRLRVGIIFAFDPKWTGGLIYNLNIIKTLNFLEDSDRPMVVIINKPELKAHISGIDYPYTEIVEYQFPLLIKGFLNSFLQNKNLFVDHLVQQYQLNAIFPMHDYPVKSKLDAKLISWYADLQHVYYPQFFTKKKLLERKIRINLILKNSKDLVVSSQAVKNDFIKFYNVPNSIKIHIYHFVSIIDSLPSLTSSEIKAKYGLPESYYIVSNQFQKHKNHLVVFKAVDQLQKKGIPVHVVLTGRFSSDSNSPYMQELHRLVAENNLKNSISFLGLIPRSDQLLLMKYAKAIIQPSLFEGWSTVIEDAKSLQVPVIASNLDVNIEQLEEKGTYFEPHDERALATILEEYPERNYDKELYEPYESRIKKAAYELLSVFK